MGINSPNPFTEKTVISFSLPVENSLGSDVSLVVYDLQGREVRSLLQSSPGPGLHSVAWDGTNSEGESVAPGIYFYRLKSGSARLTRKMTLLE
jgi:flagellar hook assembly protein FlgD